ncbi:TPA: hypothetical protein HA372_04640 [Candidatus Woesearchaeota archaeon]|nr:hypothetical protein [uncultured archaeon]HIH05582.1 hypothetical protein [Candidatus Woesearchaeota archaeon]HIJ18944.1 hypothetical protein [Candidatus Woesearchaeota archaeon]
MRPIVIVLAAFLALAPLAAAEEVKVGLYVLNLGKFDVATGSITADFYLSLKCDTNCSPEGFEFMNGRASSVDKAIDTPNEKFYRIQANLNGPVDLKRFPFDTQSIPIIIEDKTHTVEDLVYVVNEEESGIDPSIAFTGWNLDGWRAEAKEHPYEIYGETYSQYVFNVDISRIKWNSFIKTFLPIIFITLIVLFSFLLDPDKITTRLGMAGSSLVAAVMFHISISSQVPPVGYLTFADKVMLLTYLVLLASFIINIALLELQEQKKAELVERIHRRTEYSMFIIVPAIYLLFFIFFR